VNDYYNGFMRDHFLFEDRAGSQALSMSKDGLSETLEVSARLKNRLQ